MVQFAQVPFCDRVLNVSRKEFIPLRNRGIPIPTEPTTIGGHLRRRRMQLRVFQPEAARMLSVSTVTLSRWECDKVYPTWEHHSRIIDYLGYDAFKLIGLRDPYGNEHLDVANLTSDLLSSLGGQIRKQRLKLKFTVKDFAVKLSVSERTLRDWESEKHRPFPKVRERIIRFLKD